MRLNNSVLRQTLTRSYWILIGGLGEESSTRVDPNLSKRDEEADGKKD